MIIFHDTSRLFLHQAVITLVHYFLNLSQNRWEKVWGKLQDLIDKESHGRKDRAVS